MAPQRQLKRITREERNQPKGRDTSDIPRNPKYPNLVKPEKGTLVPGAGRPPGKPNKVTRIVKEALLDAMDESGEDGKGKGGNVGYLKWLSRAEPVAFAALIARIIPQQLQATVGVEHSGTVQHRMTASELEQRLKDRGLPVPTLIDHNPGEFDDVLSGGTRETEDDDE